MVPAVWVSWATSPRAASQQGPATAQPTAPATFMLTVSLNEMVQCPARWAWKEKKRNLGKGLRLGDMFKVGGLHGKGDFMGKTGPREGVLGYGKPSQIANLCCLFHPSVMWAGQGTGMCVGLTRTLMATRIRRCPAWITTNTASRCRGPVDQCGGESQAGSGQNSSVLLLSLNFRITAF